MSDAPFAEIPVSPGEPNETAQAARQRLQEVLDQLRPQDGKLAPERAAETPELSKKARKKKREQAAAKAKPAEPAPAPVK